MTSFEIIIVYSALLGTALLVLVVWQAFFKSAGTQQAEVQMREEFERSRNQAASESRGLREEVGARMDAVRRSITETSVLQRQEQTHNHERLIETVHARLESIRQSVTGELEKVRADNAMRLEEMRKTVDEKLHETLEKRLGESFEMVSKRLEDVARGLGEMQQLATGVGDLKSLLTNVKSRGTWGEYQLGAILEQIFTPDQYAANVRVNPNASEVVEYAIRLPGRNDTAPVWLPIDAKFPKEDYERVQAAAEISDKEALEAALKALERRIRDSAKDIRDKYLFPPFTTDFGILFLPTEGLYAEVLRRPGLVDDLQRLYRVNVSGPTTLMAMLNSLQMGFRTLAIEKRSSEVWQVLAAVKTEFVKFGDVFERLQKKLNEADKVIEDAGVRTRKMSRALKHVETIPELEAQNLLGDVETEPDNQGEAET
ncbi:MAG: DNA recombination protein RmuC [bacterium]